MARRNKTYNSSQITPFNAPDPVMPWEDTNASHGTSDSCRLDEGSYQAPVKKEDSYEATSPEELDWKSRGWEDPNSWSQSSGATTASAPRKKNGCVKWFVIVAVLIMLVPALMIALASCGTELLSSAGDSLSGLSSIFDDEDYPDDDDDYYDDDYYDEYGYDDVIEDEAAAEAMESLLADATENTDLANAINADIKEEIGDWVGRSPDELGISVSEYTTKSLETASFEITNAYVIDDYTSIYVTSNTLSSWQFASEFYDNVHEYLSEQNLLYGDPQPSADQTAEIQKIFDETLANFDTTQERSLHFKAVPDGEDYSVDEASFYSDVYYAFGLNYETGTNPDTTSEANV